MSQLNLTHSYPVRRVAELMEWIRSGDYDRITGGDYPRRRHGQCHGMLEGS